MSKTEVEIMNENAERYRECMAAVKLGISKYLELETEQPTPAGDAEFFSKMDMAICDHLSLVGLLASKGIIDHHEYIAAIAETAEERVKFYEDLIKSKHRIRFKLL